MRQIPVMAKELVLGIQTFLIKGVIEILSSNHKLGGLNSNEDKVGNRPALTAYTPPQAVVYMAIGGGYCFIRWKGTPRPVIWIKQRYISYTLFISTLLRFFGG